MDQLRNDNNDNKNDEVEYIIEDIIDNEEVKVNTNLLLNLHTNYTTVLSIDIGMNNLALYKERIDLNIISTVKKLPKSLQYNDNGEFLPQMKTEFDKLYKAGARQWIDKVDITRSDDKMVGKTRKRRVVTNRMLLRLSDYLDKLREEGVFNDIDTIIIEKQMKTNPNAQEIQHHIRSYFLFYYKEEKDVIAFHSKYKTQILGCFRKKLKVKVDAKTKVKTEKLTKITKLQRKNWAKERAMYILSERNDMIGLNFIFNDNKNKADDLSDCICQLQAFIYLKYVVRCFEE